jgi:hypothetical protein
VLSRLVLEERKGIAWPWLATKVGCLPARNRACGAAFTLGKISKFLLHPPSPFCQLIGELFAFFLCLSASITLVPNEILLPGRNGGWFHIRRGAIS